MELPGRYDRNHSALSDRDCARLADSHVVVVGCGGLGGTVIELFARIGIGHLRIIDPDVFEASNLNRQLFATETTLGQEKALAAAKRVAEVNSSVEVEPIVSALEEENAAKLIAGSSCVVDCLDNLESRLVLAHACGIAGVPVVYGAIAGWFGQVCTVFPSDVSFASVYGDTHGESQHLALGNLPFTAWSVASFQAAEAVKVVLGKDEVLRNRLLMIDLLDGSVEEMELR